MAPNLARPTSMLRKQVGQMKKLLGLWDNSPKKNTLTPNLVISKGAPQLLQQTKFINTKQLTRRQIVLNRHYTEIITDILSTEQFNLRLNDLDVRITSIETKAFMKGVDVYYSSDRTDFADLTRQLNNFVPVLRKSICDRQLTGRVPHINFIYDKSAATSMILEKLLEKANKGKCIESKQVMATSNRSNDLYGDKTTKTNSINEADGDIDEVRPRFHCPDDMNNNILGLDYVTLYQKVLNDLAKQRAAFKREFRAVSDPLPPSEWTNPIFVQRPAQGDNEDLDPETRLHLMKRFISMQRKKNSTLARSTRLNQILHGEAQRWQAVEDSYDHHEDVDVEDYPKDPFSEHYGDDDVENDLQSENSKND